MESVRRRETAPMDHVLREPDRREMLGIFNHDLWKGISRTLITAL
jgi:hypothetical protein